MPKPIVYHFRPPMDLLSLDRRALHSQRDRLHRMVFQGEKPGSASVAGPLHPNIARRLGKDPKAADMHGTARELRDVIGLRELGIKGMSIMPATVSISQPLPSSGPGPVGARVIFEPHSVRPPSRAKKLPEDFRLQMSTDIYSHDPGEYFLSYYGMQGSRVPEGTPARGRNLYHYGAPTLGLALLSNVLARRGARRVYVPGAEFTEHRKGFKPDFLVGVLAKMGAQGDPEALELSREIHGLNEGEIIERLRRIFGGKLPAWAGFHPTARRRYYETIPHRFPGEDVTLDNQLLDRPFRFRSIELGKLSPLSRFVERGQ